MNSMVIGPRAEVMAGLLSAAQDCPERPEAWRLLALHHLQQHEFTEARQYLARAIKSDRASAENWVALGLLHKAQGKLLHAESAYRRALYHQPGSVDAWFNLGNAYHARHRWEDAALCFSRAHELAPGESDILTNLGGTLSRLGRLDEASARLTQALEIAPDNALAQWNRANARLTLGQFESGWRDYESRWNVPGLVQLGRAYPRPLWNKNLNVPGVVVLAAEQGFGDSIQFVRYAIPLAQRGWKVIVDSPPPLTPLLRHAEGVTQSISWNDPLPTHDCWLPLPSAGSMLFAEEHFGKSSGYLQPPANTTPSSAGASARGPRIGIVWQGNAEPDPLRSIPTPLLAPLLSLPQIEWVSLQLGPAESELSSIAPHTLLQGKTLRSFLDSALTMRDLDLVLTVDTSTAHLAGALGIPVWTLLPWSADWRWMRSRSDSPWYSSMRLFRQPKQGDWTSVIAEIIERIPDSLHPETSPRSARTPVHRLLPAVSVVSMFAEASRAHREGRLEEAERDYRRILLERNDDPSVLQNLVPLLKQQGRWPEAIEAANSLVRSAPQLASSWNNRGSLCLAMDRLEEALQDLDQALAIDSHHREATLNRAIALRESGRVLEAIDTHTHFLHHTDNDPHHHWNLGFCEMLLGRMNSAWDHLAWRWKFPEHSQRNARIATPAWEGDALNGRVLLLLAEQGFGDTIQFARYLPEAIQRAQGRILLECPKELHSLLHFQSGIELHARETTPPPHQVHAPLMCLPRVLKLPNPRSVPAVGYLGWPNASPIVPGTHRLRVGLVWAGNPQFANDRRRSLPLAALLPLVQIPGIEWVSLQKGFPAGELRALPLHIKIKDGGAALRDFLDTAQLLRSLDLLVTCDTSVAHLAGAMAVPTWLMLSKVPDWRWGLENASTPWYPTLRLFRQHQRGCWETVVQRVHQSLLETFPQARAAE